MTNFQGDWASLGLTPEIVEALGKPDDSTMKSVDKAAVESLVMEFFMVMRSHYLHRSTSDPIKEILNALAAPVALTIKGCEDEGGAEGRRKGLEFFALALKQNLDQPEKGVLSALLYGDR